MKKTIKKVISVVLVVTMMCGVSVTALASDNNDQTEEVIQDALNSTDVEATVTQLDSDTRDSIWNMSFAGSEEVKTLNDKLATDGYVQEETNDTMAVEIVMDNDPSYKMIYIFRLYTNSSDEKVMAMFVDFPGSQTAPTIWAQKIGADNEMSDYYMYLDESPNIARKSTEWWICTLGATVACTLYSAMLFAILPASLIAGATCNVAFAYACG